ncbi:hypothetical protein ACFPT7_09280 [Acidicapsa dinghuensis]|uniref:Uncharacterized protein n=2 Tax=Acidicapsa dinghuensis TaxID=2218256 RepID=A0ABW1EER4_9BACT
MLQNFQDLEQESPSKVALWLFLARDLAVSLRIQLARTLCGQTAIVVLVLTLLLVFTERHAVARQRPIESFCFGYIFGWFAGWSGKQWQVSPLINRASSNIRSLPAQATMVVSVVVFVIVLTGAKGGAQSRVIWTLCYGFLLAWIAGWIGNRWQMRP